MPNHSLPNRALVLFATAVLGFMQFVRIGDHYPHFVTAVRSRLSMPLAITNGSSEIDMNETSAALPEVGEVLIVSDDLSIRIVRNIAIPSEVAGLYKYEGMSVPGDTKVLVECKTHGLDGSIAAKRDILNMFSSSQVSFPKYIGYLPSRNCIATELLHPVMEQLSDSVSLRSISRQVEIVALVPGLVSSLAALHKRGYLFPLMSPEDIILTFDESGSFGLRLNLDIDRLPSTGSRTGDISSQYASLSSLRGEPYKAADDIERLMYILIDMFYADLPWAGHSAISSWLLLSDGDTFSDANAVEEGVIDEKIAIKKDRGFFDNNKVPDAFRQALASVEAGLDYRGLARSFGGSFITV